MTGMALQVVRTDGILALYNGLSASLCRQVCAQVLALCQAHYPQSSFFSLVDISFLGLGTSLSGPDSGARSCEGALGSSGYFLSPLEICYRRDPGWVWGR